MKKTIIFDLDGTLVDIEPLFLKITNTLAAEFGFTPLLPEELPELKQFHLKEFAWKRLGWRIIFLPRILSRGREEYKKRVSEVALFSGILELLESLRKKGYRLGIVSSSRRDTIEALVRHHSLPVDFIASGKLFNKARSLRETLAQQHITLAETIYVGDEVRDIEACQKVGLDIISVTWGLNTKEALKKMNALTVDTREELLEKILAA